MARQRQFVSDGEIAKALLRYGTQAEAARALHMGHSTLQRRVQSDSFKKEYRAALATVLDEVSSEFKKNMQLAARVLGEIIANDENSAQVRINAVQCLFSAGLRLIDTCNLEQRVQALEEGEQGGAS